MENTPLKEKVSNWKFSFLVKEGCLELTTGLLQTSHSRASKTSVMFLMGLDICKKHNEVPLPVIVHIFGAWHCDILWDYKDK